MNQCQKEAAASVMTKDEFSVGEGMGSAFARRLRLECAGDGKEFEIAAIARFLRSPAPGVILAAGYFQTIGLDGGDPFGRVYSLFVRREGSWQLTFLNFHRLPLAEPPRYAATAALGKDRAPGPGGWVTLFDGSSTEAFADIARPEWPAHWRVEDGTLRAVAGKDGRSIRTREVYRDFELRFEWKTPPKGNSGVKYRVFHLQGRDATAFEYQLADDAGDPGAIGHATERTGALYNQKAPTAAEPKPVGEWNESAIVVRGYTCEHWLNGKKVMTYEAESVAPEGPIVLQHHGTDMWFRNIRMRRLN